jgi:hypothetical protein
VVKSPPHTARVRTLLNMFPDAKFVHLVRNPYELFNSTVNLWKSLNEVQRMHRLGDQAWVEEYVLRSHETMYAAYEQDRKLLSPQQIYELRYEDLVEAPGAKLQEIYEQLELGPFSRTEAAVTSYLGDVKNYRPNHHDLPEATSALVRQRWADYFQRYDYQV